MGEGRARRHRSPAISLGRSVAGAAARHAGAAGLAGSTGAAPAPNRDDPGTAIPEPNAAAPNRDDPGTATPGRSQPARGVPPPAAQGGGRRGGGVGTKMAHYGVADGPMPVGSFPPNAYRHFRHGREYRRMGSGLVRCELLQRESRTKPAGTADRPVPCDPRRHMGGHRRAQSCGELQTVRLADYSGTNDWVPMRALSGRRGNNGRRALTRFSRSSINEEVRL